MSLVEQTRRGSAPIVADLLFWSVAALTTLSASGRLADDWGASRVVLDVVAAAILASGIVGLVVRRTFMNGPTLRWFGRANLVVAVALLVAAVLDGLSLTRSGNVALAIAGGVAAVFGVWQLSSARA